MASVEDSAKSFFIRTRQRGLALKLGGFHQALLSSYLLNLWRGPEAVRKLIVADIRLWIELGAPERAADLFLVLRQYLTDFPEAMIGSKSPKADNPAFLPFPYERRPRGKMRTRFRAIKSVCPP
ncbi:hypothetical protein MCBRY_003179 [Methylocystis bryophila]